MLPRPRLRPSARSRRRSVPASITSATDGVRQTPHHLADPADSLPSPRGWQPPRTPEIAPDRQWPGCGALPELAQGGAASLNRTAARGCNPRRLPRRAPRGGDPLTPAQPPGPPLYGPSPAPRRSDGTPPQRRVRTPEGRPQASCPGRVLVVSTPWIAELADGRPGSPPSEPSHHRRRSPFGRGATCHQPRRRSRGRPRARPPRRRDHGAPLHRGCGGARRARPGTR